MSVKGVRSDARTCATQRLSPALLLAPIPLLPLIQVRIRSCMGGEGVDGHAGIRMRKVPM